MASRYGTLSFQLRIQRGYTRNESAILGILGLILFALVWEMVARLNWLDPIVMSSPSRIGESFWRQWVSGQLARDVQISVIEFALGFGIATVAGVALGIVMGLYRSVEYTLDPFIWFFYATPLVAFYPLIIVWLGFGFWTVIAMTFFVTTIPVTVNTIAGIRSVDQVLVRAVRSFGGGTLDVISKVVLPAALPMVLAGLRIGVGRALIGVVLGEMFSANVGLGFRMTFYGARLRTSDVLVPLVIIIVFGVVGTQVIRILEHRLARWRGA